MKIEADLHTHTVHSGHAYSTLDEMARGAFLRGIRMIAVTDHGPKMPGGPHEYYFGNLDVIPEEIYGVRILKGVEANILDDGRLDLPQELLEKLDFVTAGIHSQTGHSLNSSEEYTDAVIKAVQNPAVDMITHPVQKNYPLDLEALIKAAKKYNTILELNAGSYNKRKTFERARKENSLKLLKLAGRYRVNLAVNSDAHFHDEVGEISSLDFLFSSDYMDEKLIINKNTERVINFLSRKKQGLFTRKITG
ncbi:MULTISPECIES: phosphatase [unclassified Halanaerobium]|uniref:phosphatase n=1 Tax=unclassified Halanaerobium TaxID=2641197 RepID=UPI000DF24C34|nr:MULTISPECIES: phosphatase [unclassified Halanaerobium]